MIPTFLIRLHHQRHYCNVLEGIKSWQIILKYLPSHKQNVSKT